MISISNVRWRLLAKIGVLKAAFSPLMTAGEIKMEDINNTLRGQLIVQKGQTDSTSKPTTSSLVNYCAIRYVISGTMYLHTA